MYTKFTPLLLFYLRYSSMYSFCITRLPLSTWDQWARGVDHECIMFCLGQPSTFFVLDYKDAYVEGKLKAFLQDLYSGKLHREFHYGPDPETTSEAVNVSHSLGIQSFT